MENNNIDKETLKKQLKEELKKEILEELKKTDEVKEEPEEQPDPDCEPVEDIKEENDTDETDETEEDETIYIRILHDTGDIVNSAYECLDGVRKNVEKDLHDKESRKKILLGLGAGVVTGSLVTLMLHNKK